MLALLTEHEKRMTERAALCGLVLDGSAFVFSDAGDLMVPWRADSTTRRFMQLRDCRAPA